jgi:ferredoxin-NADP reductase
MLPISASLALGFLFAVVGAVNVLLVLEAWSRVKAANISSRLLALHRIGGYLFVALFCVMTYFMVVRMRSGSDDISAAVTLHLALAMILSPLMFIKVLIARYYRSQHGLMMPIGLTIFILAFVLVASTAGPYLAHTSRIEQVSIDPGNIPPTAIDINQASDLMQRRCSKCHNLDRVVGARKDTQGWVETVNRMRAMTGAGISQGEAQTIISYLASQNQPKGSDAAVHLEIARALVDQRCGRCHSLDRVYQTMDDPAEWREIVMRMAGYAEGSTGAIRPGEEQRIIEYLSTTQTPEAVAQRNAQVRATASATESITPPTTSVMPASPPEPTRDKGKAIAFVSVVLLAGAVLVIRRPRRNITSSAKPNQPSNAPAALVPRAPNSFFVLQLIQMTRQTADATTLRFAVQSERKLDARPGQFLTFTFLFDGKKETRCYSICSSPARSGYVEITPKRVDGGCVSVFLNERAAIGMTVEAAGPFGQFYLTPADKKIVLLAAGSGITPMMAMLRHLEDLCLDTDVTLLYCVRTRDDIMFRQELEELRGRLKRFQYRVMLSSPDADWPGARGHMSREFLSRGVPDPEGRLFFLCGPPPFMDSVKRILTDAGVRPERIRQEMFGVANTAPKPVPPDAETGLTIQFARSGKAASVREGQSLLDAATAAGVEIPSACRQGQCGTCKTRLLSGDVHMKADQGLDPESQARGFVLTCVGYPHSDVTLDV